MSNDNIDLYDELSRINNELTNMQRELYRKNAELIELDKQRSFFIGMLAHDLRNPIGNILNSGILLNELMSAHLDEQSREFLDHIKESAKTMLIMVNDTLDIAKMDSPNLKLNLAEQDLVSVIEGCIRSNAILYDAKGITIEFVHTGLETLVVSIDRIRFEQLLNNLLTNAAKFSNQGTCVQIELAIADTDAVISVTDHGAGIPENELPDLFQPFQLTSVVSTAGEKRTGLGLAIVDRIAKAHRGKAWVKSVVLQGTTFFVSIPLQA